MTLYFKRHWNETTGDPLTDDWGTSDYYFETNLSGEVLRQIQVFENGWQLFYDNENPNDDYGGLSDQPLDLEEFEQFKISKEEFEAIWGSYSGA